MCLCVRSRGEDYSVFLVSYVIIVRVGFALGIAFFNWNLDVGLDSFWFIW